MKAKNVIVMFVILVCLSVFGTAFSEWGAFENEGTNMQEDTFGKVTSNYTFNVTGLSTHHRTKTFDVDNDNVNELLVLNETQLLVYKFNMTTALMYLASTYTFNQSQEFYFLPETTASQFDFWVGKFRVNKFNYKINYENVMVVPVTLNRTNPEVEYTMLQYIGFNGTQPYLMTYVYNTIFNVASGVSCYPTEIDILRCVLAGESFNNNWTALPVANEFNTRANNLLYVDYDYNFHALHTPIEITELNYFGAEYLLSNERYATKDTKNRWSNEWQGGFSISRPPLFTQFEGYNEWAPTMIDLTNDGISDFIVPFNNYTNVSNNLQQYVDDGGIIVFDGNNLVPITLGNNLTNGKNYAGNQTGYTNFWGIENIVAKKTSSNTAVICYGANYRDGLSDWYDAGYLGSTICFNQNGETISHIRNNYGNGPVSTRQQTKIAFAEINNSLSICSNFFWADYFQCEYCQPFSTAHQYSYVTCNNLDNVSQINFFGSVNGGGLYETGDVDLTSGYYMNEKSMSIMQSEAMTNLDSVNGNYTYSATLQPYAFMSDITGDGFNEYISGARKTDKIRIKFSAHDNGSMFDYMKNHTLVTNNGTYNGTQLQFYGFEGFYNSPICVNTTLVVKATECSSLDQIGNGCTFYNTNRTELEWMVNDCGLYSRFEGSGWSHNPQVSCSYTNVGTYNMQVGLITESDNTLSYGRNLFQIPISVVDGIAGTSCNYNWCDNNPDNINCSILQDCSNQSLQFCPHVAPYCMNESYFCAQARNVSGSIVCQSTPVYCGKGCSDSKCYSPTDSKLGYLGSLGLTQTLLYLCYVIILFFVMLGINNYTKSYLVHTIIAIFVTAVFSAIDWISWYTFTLLVFYYILIYIVLRNREDEDNTNI